MADPWADPDNAADLDLLERRLEARVHLPYYTAALETALGLVKSRPRAAVELGCGTGATTRWLAERLGPASAITGLDRSCRLIERAERLLASRPCRERIRFLVADASDTGLPAGSFDLVFAATLLEHTSQPGSVVQEMARLASPGAQVVVLAQDYETLILNNPGQDRCLTRRLLNAFTDGFGYPWAGREVGGWMLEAGLQDVRLSTSSTAETSTSPAFFDYLGKMMRTLTVERGVASAAELDAWLESLVQANATGAFFLNWSFFCWSGRRPSC
jgi:ubiquinone/menaquinone biosynthesis C-methylase UbiE